MRGQTTVVIVATRATTDSEDGYGYNNLIGVANPDGRGNTDGCLYVLNSGSKGVGFYKLADGKTVGYGKACLWYDSSTTARAFFGFDETTGISENEIMRNEGNESFLTWNCGDFLFNLHNRNRPRVLS